jgi:microcompartment protein CcmL/EutN
MSRTAIGMVETVGLLAAYEAADVAVKSANVKLIGYEISRGGMVVIKFSGDIGAVKSAVDAAAAAASRLGEVFSSHVIPRPHQDVDKKMIFTDDTVGYKKDKTPEESADKTSEESQEIVEVKESTEETEEVDIEEQPEEVDLDEQDEETEAEIQESDDESKKESEEELDEAEDEVPDSEEEFDSEEEEEESEYDDEPKKEVEEELDETEYFDEDDEDDEDEEDAEDEEKDEEDICNLCGDPACPRRKGELRTDCIHYDEIMGDDE